MLGGMEWGRMRRSVIRVLGGRKGVGLLYLIHLYLGRIHAMNDERSKRIQAVKVLMGLNRKSLERILKAYGQANFNEDGDPRNTGSTLGYKDRERRARRAPT